MFFKRFIAIYLIFSLMLQLCIPCKLLFAEEVSSQSNSSKSYKYFEQMGSRVFRNFKPSKGGDLDPDDVQKIIDESTTETFVGNPTLREEKSSVLRPIKQIGLRVLDGEIGIVQTFLSYEAVEFLEKHFTKKNADEAMGNARKVVRAMTPQQVKGVNGALNKLSITAQISKAIKTSPVSVQKFIQSESNFALMAIIGTLISMGIYDGLDVSTMKDKILALDPLQFNYTASQGMLPNYLGGVASRRFYSLFNGKFDLIYDRLLSSKSFGGYLLKQLDTRADVIGKKIFKATRMGIKREAGEGLAKRLGLVGVGEGAQFTLKGFLRSLSTGIAYGLGAQLVIDSVVVGTRGYVDTAVVGGNRNKKTLLPEYNAFVYQRSQSSVKNWFKERKYALMDLYDGYRKTPLTNLVSAASGMMGGYIGSVVAGSVLIGGGLPAIVGGVMIASLFAGIGSFLGKWGTLKFERGKYMKDIRRQLVERRLYKAILKMEVHTGGQLSKSDARDLALNRSRDMSKRESFGQVYSRLFLVESFDKISLTKKGEVIWLNVAEKHGEKCDFEAHIRYDFIDLDGNQGVWDFVRNKVYDVGNVQKNSGFTVIFVTDNDNVAVKQDTLESNRGKEFRVLSNGLIMTLSDLDRTKWVIRGQRDNTDVFLRNRAERFKWNYDKNEYIKVDSIISTAVNPLAEFQQILITNSNPTKLKSQLGNLFTSKFDLAKTESHQLINSVNSKNELDFLKQLETFGVQKSRTESFAGMERSSWKNFLMGRLQRVVTKHCQGVIDEFDALDVSNLQKTLDEKIADESNFSVWDKVLTCTNVQSLMVNALQ